MQSVTKVLEGSPSKLMKELSAEMIDILQRGGIQPTGVHALALLHAMIAMIKGGQTLYADHPEVGLMPSFRMLLGVLVHGLNNSKWTTEEKQEFDAEFCRIVESLGGRKLDPSEIRPDNDGPMLISGNLGSC